MRHETINTGVDTKRNGLTYQELIADEKRTRELVEGSHFYADHPSIAWERARKFIANALHKDGTVLDIGCANGFLSKSLESWSNHKHTSYGIDIVSEDIEKAQKLFPNTPDHFKEYSFKEYISQSPDGFPATFDFIYCCGFDGCYITKDDLDTLLGRIPPHGRLLLGLYPEREKADGTGKEPVDHVAINIAKLKAHGFAITVLDNIDYPTRGEKVVIIEKPLSSLRISNQLPYVLP